jgi:hypothetical protein
MKPFLIAAILLAGAISSEVYALDLTPHEIAVSSTGPPIKRYFFEDASKRVTFRMDNQMAVSGTSETAAFRFNDLKSAGMTLSKSSLKPEMRFDKNNLDPYRSVARGFVPQNATGTQLESERTDAVAINGWTSHQFIFSYTLFGFPYRRSVTFINYSEREQLIFGISATAVDYERTYMRGYRVLNSLSDLVPGSAEGPT